MNFEELIDQFAPIAVFLIWILLGLAKRKKRKGKGGDIQLPGRRQRSAGKFKLALFGFVALGLAIFLFELSGQLGGEEAHLARLFAIGAGVIGTILLLSLIFTGRKSAVQGEITVGSKESEEWVSQAKPLEPK